jgi:hypothetical protein
MGAADQSDAGHADGAIHVTALDLAVRFHFSVLRHPVWAQWTGEAFPTAHALHIVRSILLKGNGAAEILPELWPIAAFTLVVGAIAIWSYRDSERCTQDGWRRIRTRTFGAPNNAVVTIAPLADPACDYRRAPLERSLSLSNSGRHQSPTKKLTG